MRRIITTSVLPCFLLLGCGIDNGNTMNTPSLTEQVLGKDFFSVGQTDNNEFVGRLSADHNIYFDDGCEGRITVQEVKGGDLLIKIYSEEDYDFPLPAPVESNYSGLVVIRATNDNREIAQTDKSATFEVYDANGEGIAFEIYYLIEELGVDDCFTGSITYNGIRRKFNSSTSCASRPKTSK